MRNPSVRGLGIRYLIAVLLPISGMALVIFTVVQVTMAMVMGTVPPPARFPLH